MGTVRRRTRRQGLYKEGSLPLSPFRSGVPRAFAVFPICLVPPGLTCRWLT